MGNEGDAAYVGYDFVNDNYYSEYPTFAGDIGLLTECIPAYHACLDSQPVAQHPCAGSQPASEHPCLGSQPAAEHPCAALQPAAQHPGVGIQPVAAHRKTGMNENKKATAVGSISSVQKNYQKQDGMLWKI